MSETRVRTFLGNTRECVARGDGVLCGRVTSRTVRSTPGRTTSRRTKRRSSARISTSLPCAQASQPRCRSAISGASGVGIVQRMQPGRGVCRLAAPRGEQSNPVYGPMVLADWFNWPRASEPYGGTRGDAGETAPANGEIPDRSEVDGAVRAIGIDWKRRMPRRPPRINPRRTRVTTQYRTKASSAGSK